MHSQGAMRSASNFGSSKSIIRCCSKRSSKPASSWKGTVHEPPEHLHLLQAMHRSLRNCSDTSLEFSSFAGLHLFSEASKASSSDSASISCWALLELGCSGSTCTQSSSDSSETGHMATDAMHQFHIHYVALLHWKTQTHWVRMSKVLTNRPIGVWSENDLEVLRQVKTTVCANEKLKIAVGFWPTPSYKFILRWTADGQKGRGIEN